jgi:hypothetical protein
MSFGAAEYQRIDGQLQAARELPRDQRRLVEAARRKPRPMERYRQEDGLALGLHERRHIVPHGSGDRDPATVFQATGEAARQLVIGDRRARPGESVAERRGSARRSSVRSPRAEGRNSGSLNRPATRSASSIRRKSCARRTIVPHPAQRGGRAKSSAARALVLINRRTRSIGSCRRDRHIAQALACPSCST